MHKAHRSAAEFYIPCRYNTSYYTTYFIPFSCPCGYIYIYAHSLCLPGQRPCGTLKTHHGDRLVSSLCRKLKHFNSPAANSSVHDYVMRAITYIMRVQIIILKVGASGVCIIFLKSCRSGGSRGSTPKQSGISLL